MPRLNRFALLGTSLAAAAAVGIASLAGAQQQQQAQNSPQKGQPNTSDIGQQLIDGLKNTPGCLGVDSCQWSQCKRLSIVAWFENKAAVIRWFNSPTHAFTMRAFGDDPSKHKPLDHITDENTPIMVIATTTFGGKPVAPGAFPASQFSVEMYAPLPGGASINGRLAPDAFTIPNFKVYDDGYQAPAPKPAPAPAGN